MTAESGSDPRASVDAPPSALGSLGELPTLLALPKGARAEDWQATVTRHVSALVADFPTQADDGIALREITLVALAAQKGSKDAKKRALKAIRWMNVAPPSISDTLKSPEEAKAAVRVLQPLRAAWTIGYVQEELSKNKWRSMATEFVAWMLKGSTTVEEFLAAIGDVKIPHGASAPGWIGSLIQGALKPLSGVRQPSGPGFMGEVEQLALKAAISEGADFAASKRERQFAQRWIAALASQRSSVDPGVLLQGGAIAALRAITELSKPADAVAAGELEALCRRFLSLVALLVPIASRPMLSHLRSLWATYSECVPRAGPVFKNAVRESPVLSAMERGEGEQSEVESPPAPALEGIITELISNWDTYSGLHQTDPAVRQLSVRIDDLAKVLGIVRFGDEGQVVPFDPLRHHLPETTRTPPARVIVKRRGIALQRNDGTSRVLIPAIVVPA